MPPTRFPRLPANDTRGNSVHTAEKRRRVCCITGNMVAFGQILGFLRGHPAANLVGKHFLFLDITVTTGRQLLLLLVLKYTYICRYLLLSMITSSMKYVKWLLYKLLQLLFRHFWDRSRLGKEQISTISMVCRIIPLWRGKCGNIFDWHCWGTSFNILYNILEEYLCNITQFRTRLGRFLVNSIGGTLDQWSKRIREVSQFE
jgi:hypothetical protein